MPRGPAAYPAGPECRKKSQMVKKDDLPIEQLHTGGTNERPRPSNPLPAPKPKKRPQVPVPPPSAHENDSERRAKARIAFNGLHAHTGLPLLPALSAEDVGRIALGLPIEGETLHLGADSLRGSVVQDPIRAPNSEAKDPIDVETRHLVTDFLSGRAVLDSYRAPSSKVEDPTNLAETGWGVLFAPGVSREVQEALSPLLARRRDQAGIERYKEYHGVAARSARELMLMPEIDHQMGAYPDSTRLPYYLLLVGDPSRLTFRLQTQLDVQYAVGRLDLANADEYAAYATAVLATEKGERPRDRDLAFFAVENSGDEATARTANTLAATLAAGLKRQRPDWNIRTIGGREATRERLGRLLRTERPSLLFTAGHGVGYDIGDPDQLARQGALICADWPGVGLDLYDDHCFAGSDVPTGADLAGVIAFLFSCYGAGTPEYDSFASKGLNGPDRIASNPFSSRLPQCLLAAGALAAIGHVDRTWTSSFTWNGEGGHIRVYNQVLRLLMDGYPVGWAMEQMNIQAADLSLSMHDLWEDREFLRPVDIEVFADLWTATNDARNFVVLGDPAVRLNLDS